MELKLNQAEQDVVNSLPEALRAEATKSILAKKQESFERAQFNRNEVRTKVTPKNGLSVYGLKQRFPVTLSREGWEVIISNIEMIKAEASKLPYRSSK